MELPGAVFLVVSDVMNPVFLVDDARTREYRGIPRIHEGPVAMLVIQFGPVGHCVSVQPGTFKQLQGRLSSFVPSQ